MTLHNFWKSKPKVKGSLLCMSRHGILFIDIKRINVIELLIFSLWTMNNNNAENINFQWIVCLTRHYWSRFGRYKNEMQQVDLVRSSNKNINNGHKVEKPREWESLSRQCVLCCVRIHSTKNHVALKTEESVVRNLKKSQSNIDFFQRCSYCSHCCWCCKASGICISERRRRIRKSKQIYTLYQSVPIFRNIVHDWTADYIHMIVFHRRT